MSEADGFTDMAKRKPFFVVFSDSHYSGISITAHSDGSRGISQIVILFCLALLRAGQDISVID